MSPTQLGNENPDEATKQDWRITPMRLMSKTPKFEEENLDLNS